MELPELEGRKEDYYFRAIISERLLVAEPMDLKTIIAIGRDSSDESCKSSGNFQLTSNGLLSPAMIVGHSYDGNRTVEILHPIEFTLEGC